MAAFLANVGVNSAHSAHSPLFADGRFVLLPIPEREPWAPPMLRLGDISGLAAHAPAAWRERMVHLYLYFTEPTQTGRCPRPPHGDLQNHEATVGEERRVG